MYENKPPFEGKTVSDSFFQVGSLFQMRKQPKISEMSTDLLKESVLTFNRFNLNSIFIQCRQGHNENKFITSDWLLKCKSNCFTSLLTVVVKTT